jgi:hypothetical protein
MGYSAQVQQSPGQYSSGKSGPGGQETIDGAPRAPDQQIQVGISQADIRQMNSGMPTQAMGKGGAITNSATSGQPRVGQPNMYPNTVGMGDNKQQQPNQAQAKGKGA